MIEMMRAVAQALAVTVLLAVVTGVLLARFDLGWNVFFAAAAVSTAIALIPVIREELRQPRG